MLRRSVLTLAALVMVAPPGAAGPQTTTLAVSFAAYSTDPTAIGIGAAGTTARIDAVWLALRDIRLLPSATCERSPASVAFAGPITAELVRGRASGLPPDGATVVMGRYCAVALAYRRARGETHDAPAELEGMALTISGTRGDGVRFVLRTRLAFPSLVRPRDLEGFLVARRRMHLIVAADVARWMSGLDLGSADAGPDPDRGEIRIDAHSNADLLATFLRNLDAGLEVFDDVNDNGALDLQERRHPVGGG